MLGYRNTQEAFESLCSKYGRDGMMVQFHFWICNYARTYQGCQIFIGPKYQNGGKYTKFPQNIPNGHKIFPMAIK
jgi:hypothetical protein